MPDPATLFTLASAGTAAIGIASAVGLKGWMDYLDLRRAQLGQSRPLRGSGSNIELTELRARIRRLEAIATGTER